LLLATEELDDLVICDRVLVMLRGQIFAEFTSPPFDRAALIAASEGIAAAAGAAAGTGAAGGAISGGPAA